MLGDSEKRKIDEKVKMIMQFDMFKTISKFKLKNLYRNFFNKDRNLAPYKSTRNQYLYRQGDKINGIFCLLSGQVQRIKENWSP